MAEARGCGGGKQFETGKKARGDGHSLGVEATVEDLCKVTQAGPRLKVSCVVCRQQNENSTHSSRELNVCNTNTGNVTPCLPQNPPVQCSRDNIPSSPRLTLADTQVLVVHGETSRHQEGPVDSMTVSVLGTWSNGHAEWAPKNQDPWEWKARFLEAVDDAFQKINMDMTKQHARVQMRTQINIGDEAWIGP
ncbi:hypothetical protein ACRRTK_002463 [Alexandromys fortis]